MGHSKLRVDADNVFLRTQTRSLLRDRILSETDTIALGRDANTARLKQQRLEKEAIEREVAAAAPPKPPAARKRAKPA